MIHSDRLELMSGRKASDYARLAWDNMSRRQRDAVLWHLPCEQKREALAECCRNAAATGVMLDEADMPKAISWLEDRGEGCRTASIHMALAASGDCFHDYAKAFLTGVAGRYADICAIVPAPYVGMRNAMEKLGFMRAYTFYRLCFIAKHRRYVNGCFYILRIDKKLLESWNGQNM